MVDLENVIYKLRRALDNRIKTLAISVTSGGVDNMETYKYIIGQINALEATKQELSNLLDTKEHDETKGTVININGAAKPKDNHTK